MGNSGDVVRSQAVRGVLSPSAGDDMNAKRLCRNSFDAMIAGGYFHFSLIFGLARPLHGSTWVSL